jgi:hypothetical protein
LVGTDGTDGVYVSRARRWRDEEVKSDEENISKNSEEQWVGEREGAEWWVGVLQRVKECFLHSKRETRVGFGCPARDV